MTLAARLAGKTAAETISVMLAVFARIEPALRKSITFDNDTAFAQHALLRTMRAMTTWFCDAYASWQKGGVENANGRLRRWLPRQIDIDQVSDEEIQDIVITANLTPRKCLGFKTPFQAILKELGKDVQIRFDRSVALGSRNPGLGFTMPMPRGKRAGSKTPTVDYAAGCLARSTSTKCPTKKSRTSSSPPISRPENAWASRPLSRRSSKSLAKTCKSGSHRSVALGSRIQAGVLWDFSGEKKPAKESRSQPAPAGPIPPPLFHVGLGSQVFEKSWQILSVYAVFDKPVHMYRGTTMAGIIMDEARHDPKRGFSGGDEMETLSLGLPFMAAFLNPGAWGRSPARPRRKRSRVPMKRRFRHSAPWLFSYSPDAWGRS